MRKTDSFVLPIPSLLKKNGVKKGGDPKAPRNLGSGPCSREKSDSYRGVGWELPLRRTSVLTTGAAR